ncbi:hypothetical protein EVAR_46143_1 [Eumeta japonica]|uniref:Uncharacterized protein n=1 Tax=Eumeta variegata TaxID=151549 RepID=A0A4C1XNW0_EUMVA|nr:hypothetical protein EVAR_46143_1 [Eumeta japonica]
MHMDGPLGYGECRLMNKFYYLILEMFITKTNKRACADAGGGAPVRRRSVVVESFRRAARLRPRRVKNSPTTVNIGARIVRHVPRILPFVVIALTAARERRPVHAETADTSGSIRLDKENLDKELIAVPSRSRFRSRSSSRFCSWAVVDLDPPSNINDTNNQSA